MSIRSINYGYLVPASKFGLRKLNVTCNNYFLVVSESTILRCRNHLFLRAKKFFKMDGALRSYLIREAEESNNSTWKPYAVISSNSRHGWIIPPLRQRGAPPGSLTTVTWRCKTVVVRQFKKRSFFNRRTWCLFQAYEACYKDIKLDCSCDNSWANQNILKSCIVVLGTSVLCVGENLRFKPFPMNQA